MGGALFVFSISAPFSLFFFSLESLRGILAAGPPGFHVMTPPELKCALWVNFGHAPRPEFHEELREKKNKNR